MTNAPTPVEAVEAEDMATASGQTGLLATDRCDRCGAQAYVRTEHANGELLWCKHHYERHEDKAAPFKTLDERQRLN